MASRASVTPPVPSVSRRQAGRGTSACPIACSPIAEALALLRALHRRRNHRAGRRDHQQLLDATRAHVGFVLRPRRRAGARQRAARRRARAAVRERTAGISFRGFVDELREAAETAQAAEAPILEEGSDGVRLMTVHKAKGLEFPVVILADITVQARAAPTPDRCHRSAAATCAR